MRRALVVIQLFILISLAGVSQENTLVLSGTYQGKDLYVKNPFGEEGVGFCVYEVYVNGELTRDEINSSAFAIDFNILGIETGENVEVILNHKDGCEPLVLNPEAIKPHSTFEIVDMVVDGNTLNWSTRNESGPLPFIVEQFRWNKWVKAGEVRGTGKAAGSDYRFKLTPYSGENKVRIKQVDHTDKPRYSDVVTYDPGIQKVSFEPEKPKDEIVFSRETLYEIFDKYGNLVSTGYGKKIDVANLKKGEEYYLNYDSSFGETFKKK